MTITYPRPITEVHQIEVTTQCNLRCQYCPSPHLDEPAELGGYEREKVHMEGHVYEQTLKLVKHFCDKGTQGELALTGIGEALLHPHFVEMVAMARETIGPARHLTFSTNGLLLTEEICAQLKPYKPEIYVSLHRPEKAGPAIEAAKKYGLFAGANASAATSSFNWAGQVKWHVSAPRIKCEYLRVGWCVVLVSGQITVCCLDAGGKGVVGDVWQSPDTLAVQPFSLCAACHMEVPK